MRAMDFITEIGRLSQRDYEGGKGELSFIPKDVKWMPLPGGSGLQWGIQKTGKDDMDVCIIDPKPTEPSDIGPFVKPKKQFWHSPRSYERLVAIDKAKWEQLKRGGVIEMIGRLSLEKYYGPLKNAWNVSTITVDEDRRGIGIAKALYGIVLTQLNATLVSGGSQTPGGIRNWLSLASIPGVEVKGLMSLDDDEFGPTKKLPKSATKWDQTEFKRHQKDADKNIDMLAQLGLQYVGKISNSWDGIRHYFVFDVVGGNGELAPAIKNQLSKIYDNYGTLLYARWTGQ